MSSTSKIITATTEGHHLLKIEGYSSIKSAFPNGQGVKCLPFTVAGHRWSITYYPNGIDVYCQRYVSLYLLLEASPVTARVQLSFASAAEERRRLMPYFPKKTKTAPAKSVEWTLITSGKWRWEEFIKRADLERSKHLRDDSFTVRCDIAVVNGFRAEEVGPAVPRVFVSVPPFDLDRRLRGLLSVW